MMQLFLDHWTELAHLAVVMGGGITLYYALINRLSTEETNFANFTKSAHEHWKVLEDELNRVETKIDDHIESQLPHKSCPAHEAKIGDMINRLDRIQTDIAELRSVVINCFHDHQNFQKKDNKR